MDDIDAIYSVSVGSMVSLLIALKFKWDTIHDYLLMRPWADVYNMNLTHLFDVFTKKGIYDAGFFVTFFQPFFNSRDISLDITMSELYDMTGIDMHFCTTNLHTFKFMDITHETHPDLKVLTAVQMSAALPLVISPVFLDGHCYIDGGIICNYPIALCLEKYPDIDAVLGVGNATSDYSHNITADSPLSEFIGELVHKMMINLKHGVSGSENSEKITNYIAIPIHQISLTTIQDAFASIDLRRKLIQEGADCAETWLRARDIVTPDVATEAAAEGEGEGESTRSCNSAHNSSILDDNLVFC